MPGTDAIGTLGAELGRFVLLATDFCAFFFRGRLRLCLFAMLLVFLLGLFKLASLGLPNEFGLGGFEFEVDGVPAVNLFEELCQVAREPDVPDSSREDVK